MSVITSLAYQAAKSLKFFFFFFFFFKLNEDLFKLSQFRQERFVQELCCSSFATATASRPTGNMKLHSAVRFQLYDLNNCFSCFHLLLLLLLVFGVLYTVLCSLLVTYLVKLYNHSNTVVHASGPPCCHYSSHHALIFLYIPATPFIGCMLSALFATFITFLIPSLTLFPVIWL